MMISNYSDQFLTSAEIRWFFGGTVDDIIFSWFTAGNLHIESPPRTDKYLLFPDSVSTGVKFREGKFEIKIS